MPRVICEYRTVFTRCTEFLIKQTAGTNLTGLTDDIFAFIPRQLLVSFHSLSSIVSSSTHVSPDDHRVFFLWLLFPFSFIPFPRFLAITSLISLNRYFFSRPTPETGPIDSLLFFSVTAPKIRSYTFRFNSIQSSHIAQYTPPPHTLAFLFLPFVQRLFNPYSLL